MGKPYPELKECAKDTWTTTIEVPLDAYIQYTFSTGTESPLTRLPDRYNRQRVSTGFGGWNGSFQMPNFRPNPYMQRQKGVARGKVYKFEISHPFMLLGGTREVWLYQPPTKKPAPLLLAFDGWDVIHQAKLPQVLDNMIAQKRIPPIALACIQNAKEGRIVEYAMGEALIAVIHHLVLPLAQKHLNLLDIKKQSGAYGVMGASMGGIMATYTGLRMSHVFGKVISQSGAFQFEHSPEIPLLIQELLAKPKPLKIWQDVGVFEWLIETNRGVNALLTNAGYDVHYHEANSGHNWMSWSALMPQALETLFG
jgi:enterochelin esterase-like enzyme